MDSANPCEGSSDKEVLIKHESSARHDTGEDTRAYIGSARAMLIAVLALGFTLLSSGSPDEKRVSIYSNVANYSLPVSQHKGVEYVGLLELLEPLGTVTARTNKDHWRIRYNDVDSEFISGKAHANIRGSDLGLTAAFALVNGRGLVPLSCLSTLLPRILGGPVTFNQAAGRLFIGNVAVHFTAQVSQTTPPRLVMNFSSPVNPTISTEPGKLLMLFTHEPLVAPGSRALTFDSKMIPSASFQEGNGAAEVIVTGTVPLMASFSNDGRTITISPPQVAQAQSPGQPIPPAPPASAAPTAPAATAPAPPVASAARPYFAVVDASHGGDESGAALSDQMAEKDITLAFARRLGQELEARDIPTLLLRNADVTLTLDQRASAANASGAAIYISIHATSQGSGVRLYTSLTPPVAQDHPPFLDWDSAQTSFVPSSQAAATAVAAELRNQQVPVRILVAPLRPLNNLITPAIAIEIAPPGNDVTQLNAAAYQSLITSAVALGLADIRSQLQVKAK
ncbi:MAG: N-acetylmuramoyl-L-alanine amidase [Terriglobales bacterium]